MLLFIFVLFKVLLLAIKHGETVAVWHDNIIDFQYEINHCDTLDINS